jgi:hypothetical protein
MKRYDLDQNYVGASMEPHPDGDWVRYEDAASLESELLSVMRDYADLSGAPDGVRRVIRERDATIASLRSELTSLRARKP